MIFSKIKTLLCKSMITNQQPIFPELMYLQKFQGIVNNPNNVFSISSAFSI